MQQIRDIEIDLGDVVFLKNPEQGGIMTAQVYAVTHPTPDHPIGSYRAIPLTGLDVPDTGVPVVIMFTDVQVIDVVKEA